MAALVTVCVHLPPVVAPSGSLLSAQDLAWKEVGGVPVPDGWPPGTYLDCCYCTNGVAASSALAAGYGVLTHNYSLDALQWWVNLSGSTVPRAVQRVAAHDQLAAGPCLLHYCRTLGLGPQRYSNRQVPEVLCLHVHRCDVFVGDCQPDRSWLPLEDMGGVNAPSVGHATPSSTDGCHPLIVAAYSARTLQQRLEGAKAALRAGGPAAIDARLLLTECLPGLAPAAKVKSLMATADAAMAAADSEAATTSAAQQAVAVDSSQNDTQAQTLTAWQRAAIRAAMAFCLYQAWKWREGDGWEGLQHVPMAAHRATTWMARVDGCGLTGLNSGYMAMRAWIRQVGGLWAAV